MQFFIHSQQLVVFYVHFFSVMNLPYSRKKDVRFTLSVGRKQIKDVILLLSKVLWLETLKESQCVFVFLYPTNYSEFKQMYSASSKFWSLLRSALMNTVWAYFYKR